MGRSIRTRKYHRSVTNLRLKRVFFRLGAIILKQQNKKQHLIEEWLRKYAWYIDKEEEFNPNRLKKYKAGDIVTVEFGYNVGSEQGGRHYAVVIEDNSINSPVITVVPLTSKHTSAKVFWEDVDLGVLPQLKLLSPSASDFKKSIALINQIRAISKQRIVSPTNSKHTVVHIDGEKLKLIYDKIHEKYTTKGVKRKPFSNSGNTPNDS